MTRDKDGNEIKVGDEVIGVHSGTRYTVVGAWLDNIMVPYRGDEAKVLDPKCVRKAPVRHKRWICIPTEKYGFSSHEEALKWCSKKFACIEIEFEEGEGL